jgi:branched-chain amino acid transport system permease protein
LLVAVIVLLRYVMRSPFGMLCRGIREDAVRIAAMGIPVNGTLLRLYMLSGAVAGLGGALSAISTRVVGLDSVSFDLSANALVMLVLGGVGNLGGAVAGSAIFMLLESKISAINPFHWLTIVGAVLIAAVLFAPNGLWGLGAGLGAKWRKR